MSKSLFASKTLYLNLFSLAYALVQTHVAIPAVDPTLLAIGTAVLNIVNRYFTHVTVTIGG